MLEFFGVEHGHHEEADEQDGDEAGEVGFHGSYMLERATETGVKRADGEEGEGHGDKEQVGHGS